MILIDSSVWIDHFRDAPTEKVRFLRSLDEDHVLVADLVLLELLQGARDDRHAARLASQLDVFETVSVAGPDLAVIAARNFRHLRAKGITIRRTVDLLLATYCIVHGHELLQQDRDFLPFSTHLGLKLA
jgi:predicted nucleic acid-binding protein